MNISFSDAESLFTKKVVAVFADTPRPLSFGRSFFREAETDTKEISIMVQRGTEKIAVDVTRGTEGNRNKFDKSTEKIFVPPYYREFFDLTELDVYDNLLQSAMVAPAMFGRFIKTVAEKSQVMADAIDRAYEKQCWDVLQTGIVTLNKGTNIDFKRKAGSIVNISGISGRAWTVANDATTTPYADLEAACTFARTEGKTSASVFNAIFGTEALASFLSLPKVQSRNDIKNITLDTISTPQRNAAGGVLHGELTAGSYRIRIWSYPEYYDNASGVSTQYVDSKNVIVVPENPAFLLSYAAVPQLIEPGQMPKKGKFIFDNYKDERNTNHIFDVKSAGVAIPVGVDQIYTMKVLV